MGNMDGHLRRSPTPSASPSASPFPSHPLPHPLPHTLCPTLCLTSSHTPSGGRFRPLVCEAVGAINASPEQRTEPSFLRPHEARRPGGRISIGTTPQPQPPK